VSATTRRDRGERERPAPDARVDRLAVTACTIPTDGPDGREADGTLVWSATTIVLVQVRAGAETGLGYTYGDVAIPAFIESTLAAEVLGKDAFQVPAIWRDMLASIRNAGRPGLGAMAVSAVDTALWDLRARLLGLPLFRALGPFRSRVPVYGSGGFCNYPEARLAKQLAGWVEQGIPRVKLKTSRHPEQDPRRLRAARSAIGDAPLLMTDANGALTRKEALDWARRFREEWNVAWLEEPVSSEDREGLRLVRDQGPPGLDVAAGEYGSVLRDFADLLQAGAVDCLQADVTRCCGISGLLQVAALASAHSLELSAHCAPTLSAHAFCAVEHLRHLEYFHDHVRIEQLLFDGFLVPKEGCMEPDPGRPGLGVELKRSEVERYAVDRRQRGC
jgi:L-alanine-DL-glutamate epimerase-like enolase superfamily enzyme